MSHEVFLKGKVQLCCGDSLHFLKDQPDNRYDSIVTDPPYALVSIQKRFGADNAAPPKEYAEYEHKGRNPYLRASAGFMGKRWDTGETAFAIEFWRECLRVLKPGGHVVAFGGTRTYHRLACAIEDAGFEIRDQLQWIYGSGFPKSHDVSKGIDKAAGATREVIGLRSNNTDRPITKNWNASLVNKATGYQGVGGSISEITAPATDAAQEWQGWGTALKPSCEPICLARKPLIGTVAANILQHGTGAINIDGCRVSTDENPSTARRAGKAPTREAGSWANDRRSAETFAESRPSEALGRWPANIIHDGSDEVIAAFPETTTGNLNSANITAENKIFGKRPKELNGVHEGDRGSAARFFYTAKADADDRLGSKHPTVKPVDLMQWLVRLVTPKGGLVLDPFAGTGTTADACYREGMRCMLVERESDYQADIRRRMALVLGGPEERRRESIKAKTKDQPVDHGPLFSLGLDSQAS